LNRWSFLLFSVCLLIACGKDREATTVEVEHSGVFPNKTTKTMCAASGDGKLLHVASPDWRDQVVYQMFIDRFNDGDPSNNDMGAGEFQADSPAHFNGGDLQGIIDKLPYLKNLGATAIWVTPPVLNQWWSTPYAAAGWHGYWAVNFKELDPHFGTLDTYKELSHQLHCNDMYLIQDIVANHVGNFYGYDGPYNPDDRSENFYLVEEGATQQSAPTQFPFDKIDIRNPEHREFNAYHWTPAISDYSDPHQVEFYGMGLLGDINTENPLVIDALKDSYRYWLEEVGVDGFRIDTVTFVDLPFWHYLLHDEDGIYAAAGGTGRDHFLTFGEVLVPSRPYETDGEKRIKKYFGTDEMPGLNSMLGFPLYFSLRRVLTEGDPAAQLAYRLEHHMSQYPDPYVIPNFIDNHDTARFLATGSPEAYRQALAVVFTIPGIPVIYQGTEQALHETRQSMFDGGWLGRPGIFDPQSEPYNLIRELADLRTSNRVLTRGSLEVISGEKTSPGLLVYQRVYEGRKVLVLLNTADHAIQVNRLDAGLGPNSTFRILFKQQFNGAVATDRAGLLSLGLAARSVLVMEPAGKVQAGDFVKQSHIVFEQKPGTSALERDFKLIGTIDRPNAELQLIMDGNLDNAMAFTADDSGLWEVVIPVRDLGQSKHYLQVYHPASHTMSERVHYLSHVDTAAIELTVNDDIDDAFGPTGSYGHPLHADSAGQREIESVTVRAAGSNLELSFKMKDVTDPWGPPNGFDNVAITTFFSFPGQGGSSDLPMINARMPGNLGWDLAHVGSGWFSYIYRSTGARADRQGAKAGVSPRISVDKENRTIHFFFEGARLGINDWSGVTAYVTTWDLNGEGGYVLMQAEPALWYFSGADADAPLIMDDLMLVFPTVK